MERVWHIKAPYHISTNKDFFYFKFDDESDKNMILEGPPIFIDGKYFALQPWSPNVENQRESIQYVPIWIKMHNILKEFWDSQDGVGYTASLVRKPVRSDLATVRKQTLDFTKVCMKITANQEQKTDISMNVRRIATFQVKYLWVPSRCLVYSKFGHDTK